MTKRKSTYPDYPDLSVDGRMAARDEILAGPFREFRVDEDPHYLGLQIARPEDPFFHAAMLQRFIDCVEKDDPVEDWTMKFLAFAFKRVLAGGPWRSVFMLPGREEPSDWSALSTEDKRGLEVLFYVRSYEERSSRSTTKAIRAAAEDLCISYESARDAYYSLKKRLSAEGESEEVS